jgi:Calx-beta domain
MKNTKKIIYHSIILSLVTSLLFLASCKEEMITFAGQSFVRFTDTTLTFSESYTKAIKIKVNNAGAALSEGVTVSYTVGGTAKEGRDYKIEGTKGTVFIPSGQSFGEISVKLLNNSNNILESSTIEFTLTDATPKEKLQVGLNGGKLGKTMILTIKDACIFDGTYTGALPVKTQLFGVADIDISSTDCRKYTIDNLNVGFTNFSQFFGYADMLSFDAEHPKLTFVDNGNNTLTIPKQVIPELPTGFDTLSGTGLWNPQNKRITLSIRMKVRKLTPRKDTIINLPLYYIPQ